MLKATSPVVEDSSELQRERERKKEKKALGEMYFLIETNRPFCSGAKRSRVSDVSTSLKDMTGKSVVLTVRSET